MLFPPDLVPHVRSAVDGHPALRGVPDRLLAELLNLVFFASLEREEGSQPPIRVVFSAGEEMPTGRAPGLARWTHLAFSQAKPCTAVELRRLSRATMPDSTFVHIAIADDGLVLRGLARQGIGAEEDRFLAIVAPDAGRLELWAHGRRELDYAHGRVMPAPENVILAAGPVQRALRSAADAAGVPERAWPAYLDGVAGIVRAMSAHGHGGILIIASRSDEAVSGHGGFFTEPSGGLTQVMERLASLDPIGSIDPDGAVVAATSSAELQRDIAEIGGLTALDGATILDPDLSVRAFGVILPAGDHTLVYESSAAEPRALSLFRLDAHGARHRAAAAFARARPDSIVFVASSDGELGCMLCHPHSEAVLVWRVSGASVPGESIRAPD